MLILTRKRDDKIVIPELGVEILVVSVVGRKVRLGIKAPKDASILRGVEEPKRQEAAP